jgi:signal transduction histidine kinase/CheY-like chemotaxis protein
MHLYGYIAKYLNIKQLLFVLYLCFLGLDSFSYVIEVDKNIKHYSLTSNCVFYIDTTQAKSIHNIKTRTFNDIDCFKIDKFLYPNNSAFWFKYIFNNPNTEQSNIILSVFNNYVDDIEVFTIVDSVVEQILPISKLSEISVSYSTNNIINYYITLKNNKLTQIFVKVDNGKDCIFAPVSISSSSCFVKTNNIYLLFKGFFYGITLVLLFVIIARFYSTRDALYFLFTSYIIFSIVRFLIIDHLFFQIFPYAIGSNAIALRIVIFISIFIFFEITNRTLQLHLISKKLNYYIRAFQYLILPLIFLLLINKPLTSLFISIVSSLFFIIYIFIYSIIERRKYFFYHLAIALIGLFGIVLLLHSHWVQNIFVLNNWIKIIDFSINTLLFITVFDRLYKKKEDLNVILRHRNEQINEHKIELEKKNKELQDKIIEHERSEQKRKSLEAQLIQSQKMETVGRLAGSIAHDFNNILTPIIGHTDIALEQLPDDSDVREDLELVIKASFRAKDLINQILTFSRDIKEKPEAVNIDNIIKEFIQLTKPTLSSSIKIEFETDSSCAIIEANPTRIQQVVMNICTNAIDSMNDNGGVLSIKRTVKDVKNGDYLNLEQGRYVHVIFQDTGSGIDEELKSRIFEPFFTTKKVGKGTGLGLAVVHGIVKSCKGEILVDSEVGKGTCFELFFPCTNMVENDFQKCEKEKKVTGNETILVVDDEEVITTMLRQQLGRYGFKVVVKNDGQQALDEFKSNPQKYHLVITDQRMPKLNGDELSIELKKINPQIKIIIISGYTDKVNENYALTIGVSMLIPKPFEPKYFISCIRKVLDEK